MSGLPAHASGMSMAMTCGSERPDWYRNSTALSSEAESLPPGTITGNSLSISLPCSGLSSTDCRAFIQLTLPRMVLISPLCAHVAVRVRQLPARKRVGGKALVNQGQGAGHQRIGQLEVELLDLRRQHQTLVDNGATGKRGNVEELVLALDVGIRDLVLDAAAHACRAGARMLSSSSPSGRPTKNCSM